MTTYPVFVYGTLKEGYGNHYRILKDREGVRPAGRAVTVAHYRMLDSGFPVLREDDDGHRVLGELYWVNTRVLKELDALEGEGHMYHRRDIQVRLADESLVKVQTYIGADSWDRRTHYVRNTDYLNADGLLEWKPESYKIHPMHMTRTGAGEQHD